MVVAPFVKEIAMDRPVEIPVCHTCQMPSPHHIQCNDCIMEEIKEDLCLLDC